MASVKSEMKAFLQKQKNHKDVVQIVLTNEQSRQVYWENENEFRFNDEMYDVIEKKICNNQIIIRCISDKKETTLLNEYQKNNNRNSSNSVIAQLITAAFILPIDCSLQQPKKIIQKNFIDHSSSLQKLPSTIVLPPPDVC
jgi:hypothetical protein